MSRARSCAWMVGWRRSEALFFQSLSVSVPLHFGFGKAASGWKPSFAEVQLHQVPCLALSRGRRKAGHGWPAAASQPGMADRAEEPFPAQGQAAWRSRLFAMAYIALEGLPAPTSSAMHVLLVSPRSIGNSKVRIATSGNSGAALRSGKSPPGACCARRSDGHRSARGCPGR